MLRYYKPTLKEKINHKKLISLVIWIGSRDFNGDPSQKHGFYKRGRDRIKEEIRRMHNKKVSKTEIKSFLFPTGKCIVDSVSGNLRFKSKIPFSSYMIYETIIHIVQSDLALLEKCRSINKYKPENYCKKDLIDQLSSLLCDKAPVLLHNSKKESKISKADRKHFSDLYYLFRNNTNMCCLSIKI